MERELFFNEVSSYLAANHPNIFIDAMEQIFRSNEKELFKHQRRIAEVLSKYGISSELLPKNN